VPIFSTCDQTLLTGKFRIGIKPRASSPVSSCTAFVTTFTPEDMEAVRACLDGIDPNVPVTVEPAADKLLMPNTVRTVADILALAEMACRTASARGGTLAAGRRGQDRADTLMAGNYAVTLAGHFPVASENFLGGAALGPANSFGLRPITIRADKDKASRLPTKLIVEWHSVVLTPRPIIHSSRKVPDVPPIVNCYAAGVSLPRR
jgi:hypothetical protein